MRCENCKLERCPPECFNTHVGSMIALKKLIKQTGKKVYIAGENPKEK